MGSIGESVAAGAVFTIPAFVMAGLWPGLRPADPYWKSVALMMIGSTLGILFVIARTAGDGRRPRTSLFPNRWRRRKSTKPDSRDREQRRYLFANMGFGGIIYLLGAVNVFSANHDFHFKIGRSRE